VKGLGSETRLNGIVLATSAIAEDDPCVSWTRIMCQAVIGPASGDLVIVLPDDRASLAEAALYRGRVREGELLFFSSSGGVDYCHRVIDPIHPAIGVCFWGISSCIKMKTIKERTHPTRDRRAGLIEKPSPRCDELAIGSDNGEGTSRN
jgi:hypothetical protein